MYNWGIIGAGKIANKFAIGLKELTNANSYAVAARSFDRAEEFRQKYDFEKAYGSYEEMLSDSKLDIVYIATTNNLHYEHVMMCLDAGKAVLCEKPFALSLEQVEKMIAKAKEKNVFLMEALWSRFLPSMIELKNQMSLGIIGKPFLLQCDFGFVSPFDPYHRVYDPDLGGGSVLDIGIYPIFTALYLFGNPTEIKVMSVAAPTGTDWTTSIMFKHQGKEMSMLTSSFEMILSNEAKLFGEKGCLKLNRMFHKPTKLTLTHNNLQEYEVPVQQNGNGFNYEAAEVMACLDNGLIESPNMPWQFSIDLMKTMEIVIEKAKANF
ncbi:Gfo/Idh/MocA family oxidoreductase [Bacteroidales bacterium OttesenSCG-928-I14]|nr:Gfo/Idh/MocA family oxidoreductase [Bacteroidales bacterium OttesenSCG-928-I14]